MEGVKWVRGTAHPLVWMPSGLQWLPFIVAVVILYESIRAYVFFGIKRGQEKRVDHFLRTHDIPNDPFRYMHRVVVKERVIGDPGLVEAMARRARQTGTPVATVRANVREWLDEIVPQFSVLAYYQIGYRIARAITYGLYNVQLDQASLEAARAKIPKGASVVYVSNHRSNADFVVTGFMLSKSVQVSYAVGEWARVWPLESLFKAFGSYFVRRGERDPLYHRTLEAYIQLVTKSGSTQAVFPEGGLSRDGKMREAKLGLLDSMAKTKLDPDFTRPLVFIPVGINFDRILEDDTMLAENRGEGKPKRTFAKKIWRLTTLFWKSTIGLMINAVRLLTRRLKKHGVAAINFGEPIVFDDWYKGQDFLDEPDRHTRWEKMGPFGEALIDSIGHVIPATPVTFLSMALTRIGQERVERGVDRGDIILAMRSTRDALHTAGAPFATGDPYAHRRERLRQHGQKTRNDHLASVALDVDEADDLDALLDRALDVAGPRGVLRRMRNVYSTERWDLVEYYANSLSQHLKPAPSPIPVTPVEPVLS
jgi:glycerol-3-phosphate O-acyltransferase